jgi:hypothetical protein
MRGLAAALGTDDFSQGINRTRSHHIPIHPPSTL